MQQQRLSVRSRNSRFNTVLERVKRFELSTASLATKYSTPELHPHITVYRVTRKLAIKAGFVSNSLARKLLSLPHSFGLVSYYNFDTVFTYCAVMFKLNNLHNVRRGFSSPSENSDYINGGDYRTRTDYLLLAKQSLYPGELNPQIINRVKKV